MKNIYLSSDGEPNEVRVGTPIRSIPAFPGDCTESICNKKKEIRKYILKLSAINSLDRRSVLKQISFFHYFKQFQLCYRLVGSFCA